MLAHEHHYIVVVDVLLAIGKAEEAFISFIERLFLKLYTKHMQSVLEGSATAAGS